MRLIGGFFVGHCASAGRPQRDSLARMFVYQQQVFLRRRLLLAAGMRLVQGGILGALAAALRPIQGDMGGARQHEVAGGDRARVVCRRPSQIGEGALQDGPPVLPPRVGLGLAPSAWHAVQGVQRMGLLLDKEEEHRICRLQPDPCGATPDLPLAHGACEGLVRRRACCRGRSTCRQHTRTCLVRQAGRGENLSWSVFQGRRAHGSLIFIEVFEIYKLLNLLKLENCFS